MCAHDNLVYVGPQYVPSQKEPLHLFNCCKCWTTLGIRESDPRFKKSMLHNSVAKRLAAR